MATKKAINVPNAISFARMLLGPLFFFSLRHWGLISSLVILGAALISDCLDGFLARALKQMTRVGIVLDSIADKVFAIWVVCALLVQENVTLLQLFLILTRDILVLLIGGSLYFFVAQKNKLFIEHSVVSKVVTGLQYVTIFLFLVRPAWGAVLPFLLGFMGFIVAIDYSFKWRRALQ